MLAPLILFTEGLSGHEIGIDKGHLIGVLHRKVDVLRLAEGNLVIVGVLQRHLIATEMGEDVIAPVLPCAGGIEDVSQLIYQRRFAARLAAEDRHRTDEEGLHLGGNVFPVAERVSADLPAADVHKGAFRIDQHRLNLEVLLIGLGIGLFRGVDPVGLDPFLIHKSFDPFTPHVPAVRVRLHSLFVKGMDTNIFLVFKGL